MSRPLPRHAGGLPQAAARLLGGAALWVGWVLLASACSSPLDPQASPIQAASSSASTSQNGSLSISGTLRLNSPSGSYAAGVTVRALGAETLATTSGSDGYYSFGQLAAGVWQIQVETSRIPVYGRGEWEVVLDSVVDDMDVWLVDPALVSGFAGTWTTIAQIQGRSHTSPYLDQTVRYVPGVVCGVHQEGYRYLGERELWIQSPYPDTDDASSEGVSLVTTRGADLQVGDFIVVLRAPVSEESNGEISASSHSTWRPRTCLKAPYDSGSADQIVVLARGIDLPGARVIGLEAGPGVRVMPTASLGGLSMTATLDVRESWLDFMESLEGMTIAFEQPRVLSPTDSRGVAGIGPAPLAGSPWGAVGLSSYLSPQHPLSCGQDFDGSVRGICDFRQERWVLMPTVTHDAPDTLAAGSVTMAAGDSTSLRVASLGARYLSPEGSAGATSGQAQALAETIAFNLGAPDIVALQDVGDDSGSLDDGNYRCDQAMAELNAALLSLGYTYNATWIDPVAGEALETGLEARNVILWRQGRVRFQHRVPEDDGSFDDEISTSRGVAPMIHGAGLGLDFSPGRIDPASPTWASTPRSLAAEFEFQGQRLIVVANRLRPPYGNPEGPTQPWIDGRLGERDSQAAALAAWVKGALALDDQARLIVLGQFESSPGDSPARTLEGSGLEGLLAATDLPDHWYLGRPVRGQGIFVSPSLARSGCLVNQVPTRGSLPWSSTAVSSLPVLLTVQPGSASSTQAPVLSLQDLTALNHGAVLTLGSNLEATCRVALLEASSSLPRAKDLAEGAWNGSKILAMAQAHVAAGDSATLTLRGQIDSATPATLVWAACTRDGTWSRVWTQTLVTRSLASRPLATGLFICGVLEGDYDNKAIEIANFTGAAVNLASYRLARDSNGNGNFSTSLALSGTLAHGGVLVVSHNEASPMITGLANLTGTYTGVMGFSGNDQLALQNSGGTITYDRVSTDGGGPMANSFWTRRWSTKSPSPGGSIPGQSSQWLRLDYHDLSTLGEHDYDPVN